MADVDRPLCACIGATKRQGDGLYPPGLRWLRPRCAGLPCDARSHGPVAKLALLTSFAPLGQRRRVRGRGAPASRRAGHAPCASRRRRFAPAGTARRLALAPVVFAAKATVAALAAGGSRRGDLWGAEKRSAAGGVRRAAPDRRGGSMRRRGSAVAEPPQPPRGASIAGQSRAAGPPQCEPLAGAACRDAMALKVRFPRHRRRPQCAERIPLQGHHFSITDRESGCRPGPASQSRDKAGVQ